MTTGTKPWDLELGTSDVDRYLLGRITPGYSELVDSVEEFGSGEHMVLIIDNMISRASRDFRYPGVFGRLGPAWAFAVERFGAPPVVGYPPVASPDEPFPASYPTQTDVLEAIEGLRARLGLTVETTARLLGVEKRTFHGWKSGEPMPFHRLQTAMNALVALGRLAADDPAAARKVFEEETVEATKLVATGQFAALCALVDRASAALAREMAAVSPAIDVTLALPEDVDPEHALKLLNSPEFDAVTAYMESFAPETHASTAVWRPRALLELQAAASRLSSGDELGEDWLFLVATTRSSLNALEQRAISSLRDPGSTEATWKAFVAEEAERAWSTYSVPVAERAEKGSHDPDASVRPASLYDFRHFGLNLATGQVREGS